MKFAGSKSYVATDDLKVAVNAAITLQRPLLIMGEPGTGKTVLAIEVAKALGAPLIEWHIKSTTKAQQGLYEYDAVSRLRDSQLGDEKVKDIRHYIKRGKLWEAFTNAERPVLLIDEIDKADIEFPNDLLQELDRMEFYVYELNETIKAKQRPIVMITSNNEKELPDAFLRRCFFHFIKFPDADTMRQIVDVHFPGLKGHAGQRGAQDFLRRARRAGHQEEAVDVGIVGLAEAVAQRGHRPRDAARAGPEKIDPAAAWCPPEERAGRASVRTSGLHGTARQGRLMLVLPQTLGVAAAGADGRRHRPAIMHSTDVTARRQSQSLNAARVSSMALS